MNRQDLSTVVIKEYTDDYPRELLERLSTIRQKNVVQLLHSAATDHGFVVVEEYVQGVPLQDMLDGGKRFDARETVEIGLQLCSALEALHGCGIVHRDIKSANIMMCDDGSVKLLDLHSARIHRDTQGQDTTLLGTQGYAPPEQFGFTQTDFRSDIYALGVTLYELHYGQLPDMRQAFHGKLRRVFRSCLAFSPRQRVQHVQQLRRMLLRTKHQVRHNIFTAACVLLFLAAGALVYRHGLQAWSQKTRQGCPFRTWSIKAKKAT